MIIKIFGYYLLIFISIRFKDALKKTFKAETKQKTNEFIAVLIAYVPLFIFIISQLVKLGLKF